MHGNEELVNDGIHFQLDPVCFFDAVSSYLKSHFSCGSSDQDSQF